MARPLDIPVIDLMMDLPNGQAGMGMSDARKLMRDKASEDFSHHPAQYLFKDAPDRMGQAVDPDTVVEMMDRFGVRMAMIHVDIHQPENTLTLFEKHPGRFLGEVGTDPNMSMDGVRRLEEIVKLHPNIVAAAGAPCLLNPQVPIDDRRWYPIYAKCCELDIPINMLVGVPGPRVPYKCQYPGLLDEVAWFFPELKIVMRHGGDPWTDLCVKMLLKWPNLYYSTSAWAPKHYAKNIIEFANKRGKEKILFAGYYPALSYERIFREMDDVSLSDEAWPYFLSRNAHAVYKLDGLLAAAPA
ncbi:MAG: amidohydrolase family protein [Sphingomonadales bacterium]|nr:amidohydrolase family protein [Sphingomonadales bacterium]